MSATPGSPSDDKGPRILSILWALTGFTTVVVATRIYIRCALLRKVGIDDYLIVFSLVSTELYRPCPCSLLLLARAYVKLISTRFSA